MSTKKEKCCENCLNITQSLLKDERICEDADCPCHQSEIIEWEREFDERFRMCDGPYRNPTHTCSRLQSIEEMKSFLLQKLQEERERIDQEISSEITRLMAEEWQDDKRRSFENCIAYRQALSDVRDKVLSIIKSK